MDKTGTIESIVTAHKDLPIPNIRLKSPSKKMLEAKGAISTATVDITTPKNKTNLCPCFSQRYPPKKLPIMQPIVLKVSTKLISVLLILNSSIKNGIKFPLELSKIAIIKYM